MYRYKIGDGTLYSRGGGGRAARGRREIGRHSVSGRSERISNNLGYRSEIGS